MSLLRRVGKGEDRSISFPQSIRLGSREGSGPRKISKGNIIFCIIFRVGAFFKAAFSLNKKIKIERHSTQTFSQSKIHLKKDTY